MPLEFKTGKATTGQARVLVTENFLTDASIILCLFAFLSFFYAPSWSNCFHPFSCSLCNMYSYSVNTQSAMEHNAQVMLYTLLMSDRFVQSSSLLYMLISNIKKNKKSVLVHINALFLVFHLYTDIMRISILASCTISIQTRHRYNRMVSIFVLPLFHVVEQITSLQGVVVRRSDLVGLLMRRNELADSILKASTTQRLPPMLKVFPKWSLPYKYILIVIMCLNKLLLLHMQNPNMCRGCRHLNVCTVYHKVFFSL